MGQKKAHVFPIIPLFHYSSIPFFIIPLFQYSIIPFFLPRF